MCGIFGVVALKGGLSLKQRSFMTSGTITGQLRGEDGTGWILNDKIDGPVTYKRAVCGTDFLYTSQGIKAQEDLRDATLAIGHNRKTTSGGNSDYECHPYDYENVVGVHNGTIPSYVLRRFEKSKPVADVDSAEVYAGLDKADNPVDVLSEIYAGAYALVWIDKRTNSVHIARNDERPLWAASGDDGLYFASEPGMLFWLMSRYGLNAKDSQLYELDPLCLYTIPMDDPLSITRDPYTVAYNYATYNNQRHSNVTPQTSRIDRTGYKFLPNPNKVIEDFPTLKPVMDTVLNNFEHVVQEKKEAGEVVQEGNFADVVVTNIVRTNGNSKVCNVTGYMLDVTDSTTTVAVEMMGVADDGWGLIERYDACKKDNELFTVRGRLRNVRVSVNGEIILYMSLENVWSDEGNVNITKAVLATVLDVDAITGFSGTYLADSKLSEMWNSLRQVVKNPPAAAH